MVAHSSMWVKVTCRWPLLVASLGLSGLFIFLAYTGFRVASGGSGSDRSGWRSAEQFTFLRQSIRVKRLCLSFHLLESYQRWSSIQKNILFQCSSVKLHTHQLVRSAPSSIDCPSSIASGGVSLCRWNRGLWKRPEFGSNENASRNDDQFIELDDGTIYRKALYLMVKTMVSCRFSLKPIHWSMRLEICWWWNITDGDGDNKKEGYGWYLYGSHDYGYGWFMAMITNYN